MNWDWDKLQEKRQRRQWPNKSDADRDQDNDRDDFGFEGQGGGSGGGSGVGFSNPFRNLNIRLPQGGGLKYGALAILAVWLLSGIYIVNPDEQGVVLRFGKYTTTTQPGPHYHLPFPVEEVYKPKV